MKAANVKQATTVLGLFAIGATFAASVQAEMNCGSAYYQPHFGSNGVYYTVVANPF